MAAEPENRSRSELPSLAGAAWLTRPATRAVLAALASAGFEGRVVGGSVRNALMGLPVNDIDIATPAPPETVLRACTEAGLTTVATGLEHGTVTVIADHAPIEVTTLRRDLSTDGRRATVAFTDDWEDDARRRDFTINALYCDSEGRLYDPVDGYPDIVARRVRFIGDADRRIAEDYLRILRFFRFHAAYGSGDPDPRGMAACARGIGGMARLSAERVRSEIVKLLVSDRAVAAVRAMTDIGLLPALLGAAPRPRVMERVVAAETSAGETPCAMLRLSALCIAVEDDIGRLAARLRLSNEERKALLVIDRAMAVSLGQVDQRRARQRVYVEGAKRAIQLSLALEAIEPARSAEAGLLLDTARHWRAPRLPVAGADFVARGIPPGPNVGRLLLALEHWWVGQDFPDEDKTRAHATALVAAAGRP